MKSQGVRHDLATKRQQTLRREVQYKLWPHPPTPAHKEDWVHPSCEETKPDATECGLFSIKWQWRCAPSFSENGDPERASGSQPGPCFPRPPQQGTLGHARARVCLSWLWAGKCHWNPESKGQGCRSDATVHNSDPPQNRKHPFQMSGVQRSRNHEICNTLWRMCVTCSVVLDSLWPQGL